MDLSTAKEILSRLREYALIEWDWDGLDKTLTLRFYGQRFADGAGHDIVICLGGVSRIVFDGDEECDRSIENDVKAVLTTEGIEGRDAVRYRLQLKGAFTLEAVGRTYEIIEQAPLEVADTDKTMLADLKATLGQLEDLMTQAKRKN